MNINFKNINSKKVIVTIATFALKVLAFALGYWLYSILGAKGVILILASYGLYKIIHGFIDAFTEEEQPKEETTTSTPHVTVYLKPGDNATINGQYYYNNTNETMIIYV